MEMELAMDQIPSPSLGKYNDKKWKWNWKQPEFHCHHRGIRMIENGNRNGPNSIAITREAK
jgi:hypothetical protein